MIPSFMQYTVYGILYITSLLKKFAYYHTVAMASAVSLFWRVGLCLA